MATISSRRRTDKALRLVAEGKVHTIEDPNVRVLLVEGDHDSYIVVLYAWNPNAGRWTGAMCTCPAQKTCSHIQAAWQVAARPEDYDPFAGIGMRH